MEFIKTNICSADQLDLSDYVVVPGAPSSSFDNDSDLQVSSNGAVLIPKKRIENYQWVEVEIESSATGVDVFFIDAYANNYIVGAEHVTVSDTITGFGN